MALAKGPAPAVMVVPGATVCGTLTVYAPPPRSAVTTVPDAIPGPVRGMPTERTPEATPATVSVVPEMEPVKTTASLDGVGGSVGLEDAPAERVAVGVREGDAPVDSEAVGVDAPTGVAGGVPEGDAPGDRDGVGVGAPLEVGLLVTVDDTEGIAPVDSDAVGVGAPLIVPPPLTNDETEGLAPSESD